MCTAAVLPSAWCCLCPTHPIAVLASTAVMSCTVPCPGVWCAGGGCVSVLFVWWGILCLLPPRRGGGWGHRGWWAAVVDGGWHGEGRAAVLLTPRLCVGVPLVVYPVALLNGGGGCAVMPCLWFGSGTLDCPAPPYVVCSPRIVLVLLLSCVVVFVVGGEVRRGGCVPLPSSVFVFVVTALLV